MDDKRLAEIRSAALMWRYYPDIRDSLSGLLKEAVAEIERLQTIEEAAQVLAALTQAIEDADHKAMRECVDENGEQTIRFYTLPSGVWHRILGIVRG